jgi:hypothetical protein
MRGFNGDDKGKIFALADRGSGATVRVAGREIYLLGLWLNTLGLKLTVTVKNE